MVYKVDVSEHRLWTEIIEGVVNVVVESAGDALYNSVHNRG